MRGTVHRRFLGWMGRGATFDRSPVISSPCALGTDQARANPDPPGPPGGGPSGPVRRELFLVITARDDVEIEVVFAPGGQFGDELQGMVITLVHPLKLASLLGRQ